jgi:hypothetical protein
MVLASCFLALVVWVMFVCYTYITLLSPAPVRCKIESGRQNNV